MSTPSVELLPVLGYLQKVAGGEAGGLSEKVIKEAADDLVVVLNKQFNSTRTPEFRLRMSNLGRPYCVLWHEKNGTPKIPLNPHDVIKFTIGDLTEIVVKAILKEVYGDKYEDEKAVSVEVAGVNIKGHTDCEIDGVVDDIKSTSPWSFSNKFSDFQHLYNGDAFGYIGQLIGYKRGGAGKLGGWWAVNKVTGEITYLKADLTKEQEEHIWQQIEDKVRKLNEGAPFERDFDDVPEVFRRQPTGNRVLQKVCTFCEYRNSCWPNLQVRPQIPSSAKFPRDEFYTHIEWEGDTSGS